VELAAALGAASPSSLILAAISAVFTIGYVANMLGEDEEWLFELAIDLFPRKTAVCMSTAMARMP